MRTMHAAAVALAFGSGLLLAPSVWAQQKEGQETPRLENPAKGQAQTIHGTVAGVTVEGETIVNYGTDRGVVAQATFMTILGWPGSFEHGQSGDQHRNDSKAHEGQDEQGRWPHANIYFVAVTPQTKVCLESEKEGQPNKEEGNKDEARSHAKSREAFEKLELGDQVCVKYTPVISTESGQQQAQNKPPVRHGMHRVYRGIASEITILDQEHRDQGAKEQGKESSREKESEHKDSSGSNDSGSKSNDNK